MREKDIERKFVAEVKRRGGICPKWVSPGFDGMPDRIALLPGGKSGFVEAKAPGRSPVPSRLPATHYYSGWGSGCMSWTTRRRLENFKTDPPQCVKDAVQAYREDNDWLGRYIDECCEVASSCQEKSGSSTSSTGLTASRTASISAAPRIFIPPWTRRALSDARRTRDVRAWRAAQERAGLSGLVQCMEVFCKCCIRLPRHTRILYLSHL